MAMRFSRALSAIWPGRETASEPKHGTVLIMGHSHVQCLQRALPPTWEASVEIHDLNQTKRLLPAKAKALKKSSLGNPAPEVVCLCLGGNYHNQFGMIEHPEKFGCGLSDGTMPDMTDRQPIAYALIRDQFMTHFAPLRHRHQLIYDAFPKARFIHFNPPPPIGDWAHIRANPGIFRKFLAQGPMPPELRLEFYDIQTKVLRDIAAERGADFLLPPDAVRDADGFLALAYFNNDPTHGNTAYGKLMLDHIIAFAGVMP